MSTNATFGSHEVGSLTVIVIDSRALIRDCLARSLKTMNEGFIVRTFPNLDQWHSVENNFASAVIVLCMQDRQTDDIEHELALIGQGEVRFPILLLADAEDIEHVRSAFACGVRGYIPTSVPLSVAVEAMRLVDAGGTFVPPSILQQATGGARNGNSKFTHFTERQTAVLRALKQGKANKLIAYELNMREGTVKVHVRKIMRKLNVKNRTEVAIWASSHDAK